LGSRIGNDHRQRALHRRIVESGAGRTITEEEEFELDELDMLMNDKSRKVEKCLNELKKKWGDIAYLNYRELKYLELHKPKEYEKK